MKEPQLRRNVMPAMYPSGGLSDDLLGEDRCDVGRPGHLLVNCSLQVGHGSNHNCSTREGESHDWA